MRNQWLTAQIDGRKTEITGGPKSRMGDMYIQLAQEDCGESVQILKIECTNFYDDGVLFLKTVVKNNITGKTIMEYVSPKYAPKD